MNILICGSKKWKSKKIIRDYLSALPARSFIIVPHLPGACFIAAKVASELGHTVHRFIPDIYGFHNSCGSATLKYMSHLEHSDVVYAFKFHSPFCRNTHSVLEAARAKSIDIVEIFEDGTKVEQLSLFGYTSPLKGTY